MRYCFIDTNILVYSSFDDSAYYEEANQVLEDLKESGFALVISNQIIREFIHTTLAGQKGQVRRSDIDMILGQVKFFERSYKILEDSYHVLEELIHLYEVKAISGKKVHDANIVATMIAHKIPYILTHNIKDFVVFEPMITILPLIENPT